MNFKEIKKSIQNAVRIFELERKKKELRRAFNTRTEDLYKVIHRSGKIILPFPNAFVWDIMNKYFGEKGMQIEDTISLGIFVWLLENQKEKEIINLSEKELIERGKIRLMDMLASDIPDYYQCIVEMLETIEKKNSSMTKIVTQEILSRLEIGENIASDSQNE